MPRNFPHLDTPLGRAWLTAASIQNAVRSPGIDVDPVVKQLISDLAGATKLLAEIIEAHIDNQGDRT